MSQVSLMPSPFGENAFGITGVSNILTLTVSFAAQPPFPVTVKVYNLSAKGVLIGFYNVS